MKVLFTVLALALTLDLGTPPAFAQGTAFTYQGCFTTERPRPTAF